MKEPQINMVKCFKIQNSTLYTVSGTLFILYKKCAILKFIYYSIVTIKYALWQKLNAKIVLCALIYD